MQLIPRRSELKRSVGLSTLVLFISTALAFSATAVSVDITFTATSGAGTTGFSNIGAAPGDFLTATVSITPDAAGISSYGISLFYDMDFGNELDLILATELLPPAFDFNVTPACAATQQSTEALVGYVLTCEAGTFSNGPTVPLPFDIMTILFQVTGNVTGDGFDIETGLFNVGIDGIFDNAGGVVSPVFGTAGVYLIPEPSTALLVGLGLVGIASSRRRRLGRMTGA